MRERPRPTLATRHTARTQRNTCPLTQHVRCTIRSLSETDDDDDGYFTLTFREETTASISVSAGADDVEAALEALDSITYVDVYFDAALKDDDATGTVCSSSETTFYVEFKYPTDDVPLMTYAASGPTISIKEYQAGTKEYIECSGRGLCDYTTGLCSCFTGYGASDGQGSEGLLDNCGYVLPIAGTD